MPIPTCGVPNIHFQGPCPNRVLTPAVRGHECPVLKPFRWLILRPLGQKGWFCASRWGQVDPEFPPPYGSETDDGLDVFQVDHFVWGALAPVAVQTQLSMPIGWYGPVRNKVKHRVHDITVVFCTRFETWMSGQVFKSRTCENCFYFSSKLAHSLHSPLLFCFQQVALSEECHGKASLQQQCASFTIWGGNTLHPPFTGQWEHYLSLLLCNFVLNMHQTAGKSYELSTLSLGMPLPPTHTHLSEFGTCFPKPLNLPPPFNILTCIWSHTLVGDLQRAQLNPATHTPKNPNDLSASMQGQFTAWPPFNYTWPSNARSCIDETKAEGSRLPLYLPCAISVVDPAHMLPGDIGPVECLFHHSCCVHQPIAKGVAYCNDQHSACKSTTSQKSSEAVHLPNLEMSDFFFGGGGIP